MLNQNNSEAVVPDGMEQIRTRLETAAAELSGPHRGAAGFRFFHLPTPDTRMLTPPAFGALLDVPRDVRVREVTLEAFLAGYLRQADAEETQRRVFKERFRALGDALVRNLEEPRVFRVGEEEVHYFLVGWTPDGALAGLRTSAMEP